MKDEWLTYFKTDSAMQREGNIERETKKGQNPIQWLLAWKNRNIRDTWETFEYRLCNR